MPEPSLVSGDAAAVEERWQLLQTTTDADCLCACRRQWLEAVLAAAEQAHEDDRLEWAVSLLTAAAQVRTVGSSVVRLLLVALVLSVLLPLHW